MENSNSEIKQAVARKAYEYLATKLHKDCILGIGTGSTTNFFIQELINQKPEIKAIVSSSVATELDTIALISGFWLINSWIKKLVVLPVPIPKIQSL